MPKQKQDEDVVDQAPEREPDPVVDHGPLVEVRALADLPAYGASAGKLAMVPSGLVEQFRANWMIDDDPSAIEAAKSESAEPAQE